MQIAMFLTLGLQVFPSRLAPIAVAGLLASAFLIFVARPVSVFLTLAPWRFSIPDKLLISWTGLRGAVPIVMATYPLLAGVPIADTLFHLVFFIVLSSVLLQGTTIPLVARWLRLQNTSVPLFQYPQEFVPSVGEGSHLIELSVTPTSQARNQAIVDLNLPRDVLVIGIRRGGQQLVPSGSSVFEVGDRVILLTQRGQSTVLHEIFGPD
jgi:potassium/hydrogen antiporter